MWVCAGDLLCMHVRCAQLQAIASKVAEHCRAVAWRVQDLLQCSGHVLVVCKFAIQLKVQAVLVADMLHIPAVHRQLRRSAAARQQPGALQLCARGPSSTAGGGRSYSALGSSLLWYDVGLSRQLAVYACDLLAHSCSVATASKLSPDFEEPRVVVPLLTFCKSLHLLHVACLHRVASA
jgi:hypothetical protein